MTPFRGLVLIAAFISCTRVGLADLTLSVDILDAGDPGGPAPTGLLIIDVHLETTADDGFRLAAVRGDTSHGATFVYAPTADPNAPRFVPPGTEHRFSTFGSVPYPRDGVQRYAPAGTLEEPTILTSTQYYPGHPRPQFDPTVLSVVYYPRPSGIQYGQDGYILRIALDIEEVDIPGGNDPENYRIFAPGHEPAGFVPIMISTTPPEWPGGTFVAGNEQILSTVSLDWGVYVPEPSTIFPFVILVIRYSRDFKPGCSGRRAQR